MGSALITRRGGINQSQNQTYYWRVWSQGEHTNNVEYIRIRDVERLPPWNGESVYLNHFGLNIKITAWETPDYMYYDVSINSKDMGELNFYGNSGCKTIYYSFTYKEQAYDGLMFEIDEPNNHLFIYAIKDDQTFNPTTWGFHNIVESNNIIDYPVNGYKYEWEFEDRPDIFYFEFFGPIYPSMPEV